MTDIQVLNELKILALEAINNAGSGHSGSALSSADVLYTLYTRHLLNDGGNDINRDRFVLSNGHACAMLYSVLAGLNYFDVGELKHFRQFGGMLKSHPEISIPGVDCNTGPLGQGIANAVGMAIAETIMNAHFGLNHFTFCMTGDGCLQEGVGLEALSIAGLYNLNKFILLYDKNDVTVDGALSLSCNENIEAKLQAMNFNVLNCDGHNIEQIDRAISTAKQSKNKPTAIIFNTIMGKDTKLENLSSCHAKCFESADIQLLRKQLKVGSPVLNLTKDAKQFLAAKKQKILENFKKRVQNLNNLLNSGAKMQKFRNFLNNDFCFELKDGEQNLSIKELNHLALNQFAGQVENMLALSADLATRTGVLIENGGWYSATNRLGKNIAMGIREHAMGAIANGIVLHGGLNVATSTYLTFSNYMLPPIRMAGIMHTKALFTFSCATAYDSQDGVAHLPIEQLDQLRLTPNLAVFRPACMAELSACYNHFLTTNNPTCLCLTRVKLPQIAPNKNANKGAYKLSSANVDFNIMASGAEVKLALEVKELLKNKVKIGVISVPCLEVFEQQSSAYKKQILAKPIFVVESGTAVKYLKYTAEQNIFNVQTYGSSGNEKSLRQFFGLTAEHIAKKILKILKIQ